MLYFTGAVILFFFIHKQVDYASHINDVSECADHCITFSLSDDSTEFSSQCQHLHDLLCDQCEDLKSVLRDTSEFITCHGNDEAQYESSAAVEHVEEWRAHIMRSVNQVGAKAAALKHRGPNACVVTQDWAMKFLPTKFRERTTDWFAKRGIFWHVAAVQLATGTEFFVHILDNGTQQFNSGCTDCAHTEDGKGTASCHHHRVHEE